MQPYKKMSSKLSPLHPALMESWQRGFNAGVKQQREADINNLVNLLEDLESIQGIGDKTAWKLREHFLKKFGLNPSEV